MFSTAEIKGPCCHCPCSLPMKLKHRLRFWIRLLRYPWRERLTGPFPLLRPLPPNVCCSVPCTLWAPALSSASVSWWTRLFWRSVRTEGGRKLNFELNKCLSTIYEAIKRQSTQCLKKNCKMLSFPLPSPVLCCFPRQVELLLLSSPPTLLLLDESISSMDPPPSMCLLLSWIEKQKC